MAHQLGPYRFRALAEQMADQRLLNQLSRARRGPDTPAGPVVQQPEPAITITLDTPDVNPYLQPFRSTADAKTKTVR